MLYALGSNGSGQLGLGHQRDIAAATPHELTQFIPSEMPSAIRAGGNHTLLLFENGDLYLSGKPTENEGQNSDVHQRISTQTFLVNKGVRLCSATWETSMYIDRLNRLFTYGKNDRGETGRTAVGTSEVSFPSTQDRYIDTSLIIDIASGVQHTVVVLKDGRVWGWGNGRKGQLGQPAGIIQEPRVITGVDFKVVRAVCGREFTFLVGDPAEGRCTVLGSDKWGIIAKKPISISGWKDVGACWGSILVLLNAGRILSWGRNDHGQLAPRNLPVIDQIACGSEHCLALTANNQVLAWGWGEHGNCGSEFDANGDVKESWNEIRIPAEVTSTVIGIEAGCATSWIWTA